MEALLVSTGVVALAEIGDKTQLLALLLAARFRTAWPIVLGILFATLANHALASAVGAWLVNVIGPEALRWILGLSFIAMAIWTLIPDSAPDDSSTTTRYGVFVTTLVAFFLVEMGDKTQIATSLLAARFGNISLVTFGTTLGMMLANVPAVLLGEAVTRVVALKYVRMGAAAVFAAIGAWILLATWVMP